MLSLEKKKFAGVLSISIIRSGGVKNTEPNISVYLVTSKRQWAQNEKQEIHIHAKKIHHPLFFFLFLVRDCSHLAREFVESPSLEIFKTQS